jgi:hypothetical protein
VTSAPCPVCHGELVDGDLIMVCGSCKDHLGGGVVMRATGEFRVPGELLGEGTAPTAPVAGAAQSCTWCGKPAERVRKLLGTSTVAICDECVSLCADILEAELGPDWR